MTVSGSSWRCTVQQTPLILKAHGVDADEFIVIEQSPFLVGRRPENHAHIPRPDVSGAHAEILFENGFWWVYDKQSTNGTFINGRRISERTALQVGDIVYFATKGYQIVTSADEIDRVVENTHSTKVLPDSTEIKATMELLEIVNDHRTYPHFQPIVDLTTNRTLGWEALGRASSSRGPVGVGPLFWLAAQNHLEYQLSQEFRQSALHCAKCRFCWPQVRGACLFFNLHSAEINDQQFYSVLDSLARSDLKNYYRFVIEMPESLVCHASEMQRLVKMIRDRGMYVAYDDFGTGQSRISDLINVPPDFLKLDRQLISKLLTHRVKHGLVKAIVEACRELRVKTIGEGIETQEELAACVDLGINLGQGYYLCRPKPAYELFRMTPQEMPADCPFVQLKLIPAAVTS